MGARQSRGLSEFRQESAGHSEFDADGFYKALSTFCEPLRLECSRPFLVSWYNETREATAGGSQRIDAPPDSVAFALYSVPGFLDVVADYYRRQARAAPPPAGGTPPRAAPVGYVDLATDEILDRLRGSLSPELDAMIINTDEGPPYYHVQTMGAVAGVDEHVEAEDITGADAEEWAEDLRDRLEDTRDPKMWGSDPAGLRTIFGVNMHPTWGGWYAYRGLVVLRGAQAGSLARPVPLRFLPSAEARRCISEYNLRHAECRWRDQCEQGDPASRRYTLDEFFFFTEVSMAKRKRYLEMRAAQMDERESLAKMPNCGYMAWGPSAMMVAEAALLALKISLAAVTLHRVYQGTVHRHLDRRIG